MSICRASSAAFQRVSELNASRTHREQQLNTRSHFFKLWRAGRLMRQQIPTQTAGTRRLNSHFTGCGLDCFLRGIFASRRPGSCSARWATPHTQWALVRRSVSQPSSQLTACHNHHLLPLPLPPTGSNSGGVITGCHCLNGHQHPLKKKKRNTSS